MLNKCTMFDLNKLQSDLCDLFLSGETQYNRDKLLQGK